jgi:PAS domain S-box-containing protein
MPQALRHDRPPHPHALLQDRLRSCERRFRLFMQCVDDAALCMLDAHGTVVEWNTGAQRLTGHAARSIVGKSFAGLFGESQRAGEFPAQLLQAARRDGRACVSCELLRAGESFLADIVLEAIHDGDNSLLGFALVMRDRTQQHLAERRLREAREQIAHAQKIEAMGHLTGGIAHDFNNALQGIISSLELALLCQDRRHADQARRHVSVSLDAALRAGRLTQRLLSLARRQGCSSQRTHIAKVFNAMRELLGRTLGDGIMLDVSCPDDLPPLICDSGQLESALVNLAVNARDAMAGHGHLTISCRLCHPGDRSVQVSLDHAHDVYVEISVTDDGPGMCGETRRRAFEPFFTTKAEGHGTGLGLSMVHGFTSQHGGAVDIHSVPGAGTSVLLYLPCDGTNLDVAPAKDHPPAPNLRGYRILVVEDNDTIRQSVAAQLRQLGCIVAEAATGDAALSMLADTLSWDLLLSDLDLPSVDGYQLCCQARKLLPTLRVILMTGYAESEWHDFKAFDHATDALIKPFDMGELLNKVQVLLQPAE